MPAPWIAPTDSSMLSAQHTLALRSWSLKIFSRSSAVHLPLAILPTVERRQKANTTGETSLRCAITPKSARRGRRWAVDTQCQSSLVHFSCEAAGTSAGRREKWVRAIDRIHARNAVHFLSILIKDDRRELLPGRCGERRNGVYAAGREFPGRERDGEGSERACSAAARDHSFTHDVGFLWKKPVEPGALMMSILRFLMPHPGLP